MIIKNEDSGRIDLDATDRYTARKRSSNPARDLGLLAKPTSFDVVMIAWKKFSETFHPEILISNVGRLDGLARMDVVVMMMMIVMKILDVGISAMMIDEVWLIKMNAIPN